MIEINHINNKNDKTKNANFQNAYLALAIGNGSVQFKSLTPIQTILNGTIQKNLKLKPNCPN